MPEPAFIRRLKYEKEKRRIEKAKREEIRVDRRLAQEAAIKLYDIELSFQTAAIKSVQDYLNLKRSEVDYLIAELIRMSTTDPKVSELQGRIKAIHELVRPPVDPRERNRPILQIDQEDGEDEDEAQNA